MSLLSLSTKGLKVQLGADLDISLAYARDPIFLSTKFRTLARAKVRHYCFFHSRPAQNPSITDLLHLLDKAIKSAGLSSYFIPPERIKSGDHRFIQKTCTRLAKKMKKGQLVMAHLPKDTLLLKQLLCMLLWTLKSDTDTFKKNVLYILGRPLDKRSDPIVFEYQAFLGLQARRPKDGKSPAHLLSPND